jgi:hypothetical protein
MIRSSQQRPHFSINTAEKKTKNLLYRLLSKNLGRLWLCAYLFHMRLAKDAGRFAAQVSG